jgi:hypothetical protein
MPTSAASNIANKPETAKRTARVNAVSQPDDEVTSTVLTSHKDSIGE